MRFALDASPLADAQPRGVARALAHLLAGMAQATSEADEVVAFSPRPVPNAPHGGGLSFEVVEGAAAAAPRAYRARLARAVRAMDADAFLSPFSAFPPVSCPVVVTVHELPFARLGPVEGRVRALAHRRWLARDAREAAAIVVPSRATAGDVALLHPEAAARVRVVPHGFDPAPWRGPRPSQTASAPASAAAARAPYALVVGATHARKGPQVVAAALPHLRDVALAWRFVGAPPRRVVRALARCAVVEVEPHASDASLRAALLDARLLVFPSLSEGFGFPPLEAMAARVPVVAAAAGSVPEVVGDAAVLVPPGDGAALAHAVREVHRDAALRARLVEAGDLRAEAFPCALAARRTFDVLRLAAAGRAP